MLKLSRDQQAAADAFMDFMLDPGKSELVISGFAGTGKSTLTLHLLQLARQQEQLLKVLLNTPKDQSLAIHVTATTNKAAKVIAELAGTEPKTIYQLLGLKVENDLTTGGQVLKPTRSGPSMYRHALIIVDEASFMNYQILDYLRKKTYQCKILMIGDPYQLSMLGGQKSPVFDGSIPEVKLTQVHRNQGLIKETADLYRQAVITGTFPTELPIDGKQLLHVNGPDFQALIDEAYQSPSHDDNACRILAWTNDRVNQYNDYVRQLQGHTAPVHLGERLITNKPIIIQKDGTVLSTDAHCTVTGVECEYSQYYPDIWDHRINGIALELNGGISVWMPYSQNEVKTFLRRAAKMRAWLQYFSAKETWADLRPLHASTVHKSQGSTYRQVFIDLSDIGRCNVPSEVARMLYVAISRASERVILYGQLPEKYGGIHVPLPISA
jgi:hypothetical protein